MLSLTECGMCQIIEDELMERIQEYNSEATELIAAELIKHY